MTNFQSVIRSNRIALLGAVLLLAGTAGATVWPISGTEIPDIISAPYGARLLTGRYDWHAGIDISVPTGTPVHAVADGTIYRAGDGDRFGWSGGGIVILIRHDRERLFSAYLHLESVEPWILDWMDQEGKPWIPLRVAEGERIGRSGITDAHTPHLHLELRQPPIWDLSPRQRWAVNPQSVLPYKDRPDRHRIHLVAMAEQPDGTVAVTAEVTIPREPSSPPEQELDLARIAAIYSAPGGEGGLELDFQRDITRRMGSFGFDPDDASPVPGIRLKPYAFHRYSSRYRLGVTFLLPLPKHATVTIISQDLWGGISTAGFSWAGKPPEHLVLPLP